MITLLKGGELVHTIANPVGHFEAIKEDARAMIQLMKQLEDEQDRHIFALHHAQVSQKPFNFFVLNMDILPVMDHKIDLFKSPIICNARIIEKKDDPQWMPEGCASFPHRTAKNVMRHYWIVVEFQYPDAKDSTKFHTERLELPAIYAQIFQHEAEHALGKNIYHER